MANQTKTGKAFEYACLKALEDGLSPLQNVVIETNAAFETAYSFYTDLDTASAAKMNKAAQAAYRVLTRLEPQLQNPDKNTPLYLGIQEDAQGIVGDVRDILCIRKQNEWQIGLSCKHNHMAVKHSRLSYSIDFGAQWLGKPCSQAYFNEIKPLFDSLIQMKANNMKWNEVKNKDTAVYKTLLNAFVAELKRLDEKNEGIPAFLLQYLLGKNDFYKVITKDSKKLTQIQGYNMLGTLNRQAGRIKPETKVPPIKLPARFFDISYKEASTNTIIVTCDNGWAVSFRIHNASTYVEPSLKFDVQLVGVPQSLHTQIEPW